MRKIYCFAYIDSHQLAHNDGMALQFHTSESEWRQALQDWKLMVHASDLNKHWVWLKLMSFGHKMQKLEAFSWFDAALPFSSSIVVYYKASWQYRLLRVLVLQCNNSDEVWDWIFWFPFQVPYYSAWTFADTANRLPRKRDKNMKLWVYTHRFWLIYIARARQEGSGTGLIWK